jgi:hypothetical protein
MDIFICCVLGYCLLYCQLFDLYRDNYKYNYLIHKKLIDIYRNEKYIPFIEKLFNLFNVPVTIIDKTPFDLAVVLPLATILKEYPITNSTLIKYIPIITNDLPEKYIVINLNIRFVIGLSDEAIFYKMIENLCYILNNYTFTLPIVVIGHRNTFINKNIKNYSFYDKLNISKFIDKSNECDLISEPNFDNLLYDINILKNAEETFQFGFGGSFCLNTLFSNKVSSIITSNITDKSVFLPSEFFSNFFNICPNITIYENYNEILKRLSTFNINNNILYVLGHKTLTDFEVPILIEQHQGVLICKNHNSLAKTESLFNDVYKYDYSLQNISEEELNKINKIDWYSNKKVSNEIIDILNHKFKCIFITLLTNGELLNQLISNYKGKIYYRLFGLGGNNSSYKPLLDMNKSINIKYIFSYQEIYNFEISLNSNNNFFNSNNSYVIPLGVPDNIFNYENIYNPLKNKLCFVCSKIRTCPYYTNVYNEFITNVGKKYNYILLGKNNENINDANKMNNLNDDDYYKTMSQCKLLYYHSKERRHLHYHPLEAIVIGIPVIFYEESLLNSYLNNSPGKCKTIEDVCSKINRIFSNDIEFINKIILEQNKVIPLLKRENNINIFSNLLDDQINYHLNLNSSLIPQNKSIKNNKFIRNKKRQQQLQQQLQQLQKLKQNNQSIFNMNNIMKRYKK